MAESLLQTGRPDPGIVFGRFEVRSVLHDGVEGQVLAVSDRTDPTLDLVLKWAAGRSPASERASRLESEYRLLAGLRHPGLVRALDFGFDLHDHRTWLLMERAPGCRLDELAPLAATEAATIAVDVCRVLSLLHARAVIHLDLKPANILHHPASGRTVVVDLDLSAFPEAAVGRGTPPYSSPEVMGAGPTPDSRADLFSLGVTLFEILTGTSARAEGPATDLDPGPQQPEWMRGLIRRLTAADPAARPADAREVIGLLQASGLRYPPESRASRRAVLSFPPLAGRGEEFRQVLAALPPVRPRKATTPLVVLSGGPGVGKSRLVQALGVEWRVAGIRVCEVAAGPGPAATLDPVRRLLAAIQGLDPRESDLPGLIAESRPEQRGGLWDRLSGRVLHVLRARRTILVLEDVHRYDQASREFLLHFLRRLSHEAWETRGRAPVEVLLTWQPGLMKDDPLRAWLETGKEGGTVLVADLRPLSKVAAAEMVKGMVAPEAVDRQVLEAIQERTGGLPLFVRELLLANPANPHGSGTLLGALADPGRVPASVPDSVEGFLRHRLDGLPPDDLAILKALAIFSNGAEERVLGALGGDAAAIPAALGRLAEEGLVASQGGRHYLADATTRAVVAARLRPAERCALHDGAAAVVERLEGESQEVALHRLGGADPVRGVALAYDLAPAMLREGQEEEAVLLLEEVRRVAEGQPFAKRWSTLLLVDLRLGRGQFHRARALLQEGTRRGATVDVSAQRRWAILHAKEGNFAAARATIERLLEPAPCLSARDRTILALDLAEMLATSGRAAETKEILERVRPVMATVAPLDAFAETAASLENVRAPRFGWPGAMAAPLARYLTLRGDLARADHAFHLGLRCYLGVMKLRARLGDLAGLGRALHGIGTIFMGAGQAGLADRYFHRALALREEIGDLPGCADTANNLGVLMRKQGNTAEAIDYFRTSLRLRKQVGHAAGEAWSYINIANVYYERRELDAATRYLRRALDVARRLGDARSQAQILNNLGAVAHLRDRYREAIRHYREAEALDRMVGNIPGSLLKRLNLADEYLRVGYLGHAERLLKTVVRAARRRGETDLAVREALIRGRLEAARGRLSVAVQILAPLVEPVEKGGDRELRAELGVELSSAQLRLGRAEAALAALPETGAGLSAEARARLAVARARALLALERSDLAGVAADVAEGERFAERARMPGLRFLCARTRAALKVRFGDLAQAHAAYSTAYETLESILLSFGDGPVLEAYLRTPPVRAFVEDVERFTANLVPAGEKGLPGAAAETGRHLRECLFEAQRRIGISGGLPQSQEEALRRIVELSRTLRSTAPLDDLLREIVDSVVEFSRAERAFLVTVDDRGGLRIPVARDRAREKLPEPEQQISRRIVNEVLRTGRSMRLVNAVAEGTYSTIESVVNLDLRSIMCAPLLRADTVVGMLYVDNRSKVGQFTAADLELLDIFASQAAIALENARLVREFARDEKMRVMGSLAGGVAHEFNNLLAAIIGRTQDLIERTGEEASRKDLKTVLKAAQDGAVVVRRMQDFTRVRRDAHFESVNLKEVVEDILEFTRARWEGDVLRRGHRIVAVRRVPPELHVRGNPSELREVFTNLVLNSVSAMPHGGTLTIAAQPEGERTVVTVEDTGLGMTEEVRESIFDPYFTTRGREGMGLGLSIVYGIVLRHQGAVRVESHPGEGTRIVIELPSAAPGLPASPRIPTETVAVAGRRVLVVEDEESVRDLLTDILVRAGFEVQAAADGPTALRLLAETGADVVVTDLGMRPMNGWEVAQQAKLREPTPAVVLVTGWGGEIDPATARRHHVDLVLSKPFDIHRVVSVVQEALEITARSRAPEAGDGRPAGGH